MQPLTQPTYRATRVTPLSEHAEADHIDLRIGRDTEPLHSVWCKVCDKPKCKALARACQPLPCERLLKSETGGKALKVVSDAARGTLTKRQRELVDWLQQHGPAHATAIAEAFGMTHGTARGHLWYIMRAGWIRRGPKVNGCITWVVVEE
jgi:DNA-binding CsgD family transcriptional regulator